MSGAISVLANAALAHVGAPEGRVPFVIDGELRGGGTTWGIVLRDGDVWMRVCEEALGGAPAFHYRRPSTGRVLIGRADGLWSTEDGCTLEPGAAELLDGQPSLVAVPPGQPGRLFVSTGHSDRVNTLYQSDDEGLTFTPTAFRDLPYASRTLAVSDDGSALYLGVVGFDDRMPAVFVSRDGGQSFVERQPWSSDVVVVSVLGVDPVTDAVALALLDGTTGGSTLVLADADLLTLTELHRFDGIASDFLALDDAWLVIEDRQRLWYRSRSAGSFAEVSDGPSRCLLRMPGEAGVWGCGQPVQGGHFLFSEDGLAWRAEIPFLEVEERRCPEGTEGAERCAYLFEVPGPATGADAGPTADGRPLPPRRPTESASGGLSCSGGNSHGGAQPSGWLWLALPALALRRWTPRRRGAKGPPAP
ncbi:MAG: hypothetical protein ACO3JL_06345 [Myxococcota bacterium]